LGNRRSESDQLSTKVLAGFASPAAIAVKVDVDLYGMGNAQPLNGCRELTCSRVYKID
jgi:hypothetical protein